jgi:hypothetical protein
MVAAVEGGYDLRTLGECLRGTVAVLSGDGVQPAWPDVASGAARGREAVARTAAAHAGRWTF